MFSNQISRHIDNVIMSPQYVDLVEKRYLVTIPKFVEKSEYYYRDLKRFFLKNS